MRPRRKPKGASRGALVKLKEGCRDKERRPYGDSTSSNRESEGASAKDSI